MNVRRVVLVIVAILVTVGCELPAPSRSVIVYGDSQTKQAIPYLTGMVVRANGGEAICTWFDQMRIDAATHPRVVVLALNGNWRANPCVYDQLPGFDATIPPENQDVAKYAYQLTAIYLHDLKTAVALFDPGTVVYGVTPAPLQQDDRQWALAAFRLSGLPLIDVRAGFVDSAGRYAVSLDGVKLRADDGRHFTDDGARRYAQIIARGVQLVCDYSAFSCGHSPGGPWEIPGL